MNIIKDFINNKYETLKKDELNRYFSLKILNIDITIVFTILLFLHLYYRHDTMIILTSIIIIFYLSVNLLIEKGYYELSFYTMFALMILYISIKFYYVGNKNNAQIFMLYFIIPQFTYKISSYKKIIINIVSFVFILYTSFSNYTNGVYTNPNEVMLFSKINIIFLYAVILIQLSSIKFIMQIGENIKKMELDFFISKSQVDELTGLSNRFFANNYFNDLSNEIYNKKYVLAIIDIDNFKNINDTYGHNIGDIAIKEVAKKIKTMNRSNDLTCRWGGEEFLLILESNSIKESEKLLNKLRTEIAKLEINDKDNEKIFLTVTIGASSITNENIQQAIENADKNLYNGKANGKNKVILI